MLYKKLAIFIVIAALLINMASVAFATEETNIISVAGEQINADLSIGFSTADLPLATGGEAEITVSLKNYEYVADIIGLQVNVSLDTTLADYVASSVSVLASANPGDMIAANYNAEIEDIVFLYTSLNENKIPLNRSNGNLFKFRIKAKSAITTIPKTLFTVTQLLVCDEYGDRKVIIDPYVLTVTGTNLSKHDSTVTGSIDVNITNLGLAPKPCVVILAIYDDDQLVYIKIKDVTVESGSEGMDESFSKINVPNVIGNATYKIMLWDSIISLCPLAKAAPGNI